MGKLFGDRGYISKKLTELLATQDVELITTLKKNMKPKVIAAFDKLILKKRSLIETINDQLKNIFSLDTLDTARVQLSGQCHCLSRRLFLPT